MESFTIDRISKALEWLLFLIMIITAGLFVKNSFQNYQSNATGIKVLSKEVEFYTSPTMMLCFEPFKKSSMLQQYDIMNYYAVPEEDLKNNISWPVIYQEINYKIGRDFNLTFILDLLELYGKRETIIINDTNLSENESKYIELEEVITFAAGICYSITPKNKMGKSQTNYMRIKFDDSLPSGDIPKLITVTFTSKQNSYGAFCNFWKEGEEYSISIDPEKKDYNQATLKLSQHQKLDTSSGCTTDGFYWNCLSKRYT